MCIFGNVGQVRPANAFLSVPASRTSVTQRQSFTKLALFLPAVLLALLLTACGEKKEAPKPMPPEVLVADVVQQDVPIYEQWVSTLNGPVNADITPKVQGYLLKQNYQNGSFVKKGQLLFEIDPRQYEAALDKAKADVARAQATLEKYTTDVQRDTPLAAQNAIPQKQLDTDQANEAAAKAEVVANRAAQQNAELNLAWTKVYSPVDGIAGVSNSQVGDLVSTATKMVTVSQTDPIWAYFNISESDYFTEAQTFYRLISGKRVASPVLEFIQSNGTTYPLKGRIILVNREVASQTGTIQLVAEFPNADAILRPGGFGRVRFQVAMNKGAMLIPQAAVIEVQSMYQVAVVEPGNKAAFRIVKVGDRIGTDWIITDGLKPGDQVIVQGFMKVREGTPVSPKPFVAPAERN
jgi:membrane fusion protein (multidrug efflux system)